LNPSEFLATVAGRLTLFPMHSIGDRTAEFSWSRCSLCLTLEGGERHALHYVTDGLVWSDDVCTDCALFVAVGQLPEGGA
jgi:hypothetical protein